MEVPVSVIFPNDQPKALRIQIAVESHAESIILHCSGVTTESVLQIGLTFFHYI